MRVRSLCNAEFFIDLCLSLRLHSNHQAVEEGAVVLQGRAEIFSRDIIALVPLPFQRAMFVGKFLSDFLNHLRYKRIRQQLPKVQVVALLSFKEQKMVQNALQAGVIGYLLKAMSADELAHAIRAAHPGAQPCLQRPPRHWSMLLPSRPCLART